MSVTVTETSTDRSMVFDVEGHATHLRCDICEGAGLLAQFDDGKRVTVICSVCVSRAVQIFLGQKP